MTKNKAPVKEKVYTNLFTSPHIGDLLVGLITGEWKPNEFQQEQLIAHLVVCHECRETFITLLHQKQEDGSLEDSTDTLHTLFMQFVDMQHIVSFQDDEYMAAYAETIYTRNKAVADKQFPELAKHIEHCPLCGTMLDDIIATLAETEESGEL